MNKYYITNSIPYVNATPHIGHALEFVQSDTVARFRRILGDDVMYLCGSDENALKNVQAAEKAGEEVQVFVDRHAKVFQELALALNVHFDVFQKGSAKSHITSSQKLWELCAKSDDIYKKSYKGLYCVGCELFYNPSELNENGECFNHPGKKLEEVEEENYFFKLSKYQKRLIALLESNTYEIVPEFRKNEMLSFLKNDLQDFSISRSNERAKNWGVPVPGDPTQRMYVWFDALNIYQSGIGFGWDEAMYNKWWPADLHVIGKDIIRFHAIYWPAILLSAGLKLPKKLFVHEFFTVNGQKMSKTLGNVIDPIPLAKEYGTDALRYYCLAKMSPFSDGDFSIEKLKIAYNSDLANGLGNLVARVAKLCEKVNAEINPSSPVLSDEYKKGLSEFRFNEVLSTTWGKIKTLDIYINDKQPWKIEDNQKLKEILLQASTELLQIAEELKPFLPETAEKIEEQFKGPRIKSQPPLFPRIS